MAQRFLIAPLDAGLRQNEKPFLIPENAFAKLNNAYVYRSRVVKKPGSTYLIPTSAPGNFTDDATIAQQLSSMMRYVVGTTNGAGNAAGNVQLVNISYGIFTIGNKLYTVPGTGAPVVLLEGGSQDTATKTLNTTTGAFSFVGAPANSTVYFYPCISIRSFGYFDREEINDEETLAFDGRYVYTYTSSGWLGIGDFVAGVPSYAFHGGLNNLFWTRMWRGTTPADRLMFITNFYHALDGVTYYDPMYYYDGSTLTAFTPRFSSTDVNSKIFQARVIINFKNRLILMNVVELTGAGAPQTKTQYQSRIRFSQNGNPLETEAFYDNVAGRGGFLDAPTSEEIISAEFVRDRLLVFFERSTYELVYTGNEILPFVFQLIDPVIGCESTFSVVPFDNHVLCMSSSGVFAASTGGVERIDLAIPDAYRQISNDNEAVKRVVGIRDFNAELVYWTFPDTDSTFFPNKILCYNYRNKTWASFDSEYTCYGYFNNQTTGQTWAETIDTWQQSEDTWSSGYAQKATRQVIGGTTSGFSVIVNNQVPSDVTTIYVNDLVTSLGLIGFAQIYAPSHGLSVGDNVKIYNNFSISNVVTALQKYVVLFVVDINTVVLSLIFTSFEGPYRGGMSLIKIKPVEVLTKQYNFFLSAGRQFSIDSIEFLLEAASLQTLQAEWYVNTIAGLPEGYASIACFYSIFTDDPLYTLEAYQEQLWRIVYPSCQGSFIQIKLFEPASSPLFIPDQDFGLHMMVIQASPTTYRLVR